MVRGKPGAWDPVKCFDWGNRFLTFLRKTVTPLDVTADAKNDPPPILRVKFSPGKGVSVNFLDKAAVDEISAGEERIGFLPKWYIDEIRTQSRSAQSSPQVGSSSTSEKSSLPAGWKI